MTDSTGAEPQASNPGDFPHTGPETEVSLHFGAADILDRISDAYILLDPEWHIIYANREACAVVHKTFDEIRGKNHWEEWPATVGSEIERQYRRSMLEKIEVHFDHHFSSPELDVWLEIDAYPTRDSLSVFFRDVSERKRTADELKESEQRYRSLIDATAEIVWTNSPEGKMQGEQAGWSAFTGQTESEYSNFGWANAVHPDDAGGTVQAWLQSVETRTVFLFEHRVRRHDGVYRTFSIRAVPVFTDSGTIREWVGVHSDITERRESEAVRESLLAQQRIFLRDVLASVTEGKLLLSSQDQMPALLNIVGTAIELNKSTGLHDLRALAKESALRAGHSEERQFDLLTAASEAGMNAIVHGGGGTGQVSVDSKGTVQVRVEDKGKGISMENLPKATLSRGFSTKATLGHGLKMMLETADRVYLLTGSTGTTIVLEQDLVAPIPTWLG